MKFEYYLNVQASSAPAAVAVMSDPAQRMNYLLQIAGILEKGGLRPDLDTVELALVQDAIRTGETMTQPFTFQEVPVEEARLRLRFTADVTVIPPEETATPPAIGRLFLPGQQPPPQSNQLKNLEGE